VCCTNGSKLDARAVHPPGRFVDARGRRIHVVCTGNGDRTFVLDAGALGSVDWYRVQPALSNLGRVCAFDRPGLGWSEAGGRAFDGAAAATELHAILSAAGVTTPFVYVGHSLGANFAEIYAASYPADVQALVLIEPGDPKDMLEDFHGTRAEAMAQSAWGAPCVAAEIAAHLGIARLASSLHGSKSFSGDALAQYRAGIARSSAPAASIAYLISVPKTGYQCMDIQGFGSIPVLVLASSELREPEGKETELDVVEWRKRYVQYLASVAAKSTRGEGPVEIPQSTHSSIVLFEQPAAETTKAIAAFVAKL
jgi:pimeloyl-ACP methyl ester carboxylesterase